MSFVGSISAAMKMSEKVPVQQPGHDERANAASSEQNTEPLLSALECVRGAGIAFQAQETSPARELNGRATDSKAADISNAQKCEKVGSGLIHQLNRQPKNWSEFLKI